jgi:hypothetical protein
MPDRPNQHGAAQTRTLWRRDLTTQVRATRLSHALVIIGAAFVICTGGFLGRALGEPSDVGWLLFQASFSVALGVLSWVTPRATAAILRNDCEGDAWDLLLMSPVTPARLLWAKFLAIGTWVGSYWLALLPIFALPFVFGGISVHEVCGAVLSLAALAVLMIALSLAMSSPRSTRRGLWAPAWVVPGACLAVYLGGGIGLSIVHHHTWPEIPSGAPLWLPTAWYRVVFDARAAANLVYAPLATYGLLLWLLVEIALVRFSEGRDFYAGGLRRWYIATLPWLLGLMWVPRFGFDESTQWIVAALACIAVTAHATFWLLVLAGEVVRPGPRRLRSSRSSGGVFKYLLAPGLDRGLKSMRIATALGLGALPAAEFLSSTPTIPEDVAGKIGPWIVLSTALHCIAFITFLFGLTRWLRVSGKAPRLTRYMVLGSSLAVIFVPLAVAGVADAFLKPGTDWLLLASPSPGFAFFIAERLVAGDSVDKLVGPACFAVFLWTALGVRLLWRTPPTPLPQSVASGTST